MATPTVDVSSVQTAVDNETAKGYRGARVDPNPNSAYSQASDPMTSPQAPRFGQVNIDEYADPANPLATVGTPIYGRTGITSAQALAADTQKFSTTVPAQAVAATAQTTKVVASPQYDGTVTATFTPVATLTGDASNYRTFRLWNVTKNRPILKIDTITTRAAGVAVPMVADGANQTVSIGDKLSIIEVVSGTGVAHNGPTIAATLIEQDA